MPDDGTGKPGGSDKPPGLELFKSKAALDARVADLTQQGYEYFEFVLAKYKHKRDGD